VNCGSAVEAEDKDGLTGKLITIKKKKKCPNIMKLLILYEIYKRPYRVDKCS